MTDNTETVVAELAPSQIEAPAEGAVVEVAVSVPFVAAVACVGYFAAVTTATGRPQ